MNYFIARPTAAGFPHDVIHQLCAYNKSSATLSEVYASDAYEVIDTANSEKELRDVATLKYGLTHVRAI